MTKLPVLVFDLDGTLIDSAPDIAVAVNALLSKHDRPTLALDQVRSMIGDGSIMLVRRAFAATGMELDPEAAPVVVNEFIDIYERQGADPESLFPDVITTLEMFQAQGYRLGLCTNKPERVTREVLAQLGLSGFFDAVAGGDTLPVRKPDGRHLSWVVEQLGVGTDAAIMIGDNENDAKAARSAGMPIIMVSYGYPHVPIAELGADAVIDQFSELPAAITALIDR